MSLEEELARLSPKKGMLLTIGVFDGVHLCHQALISQLTQQAREQDLISGLVTFGQHPESVLSGRASLPYLTSLGQKIRLLKEGGVEAIIVLSFTPELAQLSAREFVGLLKKYLRMSGLVIGSDFALGRNREGNADTLDRLGRHLDFSVTVVPPVAINGEVVSSTAIRNALACGDMKRVRAMTGRYLRLEGCVITGKSRGVVLGFPTANLDISPKQALPADGVYASRAYIGEQAYPAVTNIGTRPTFGSGQRVVEVYIVDYQGNLYGSELKIDIIERLRGEIQFRTVDKLKKQIADDIKKARDILNRQGRE